MTPIAQEYLVPRILALLLFCLIATPSLAADSEERIYQVEVIVFENKMPDLIGGEQWASPNLPALPKDAIDPLEEAPTGAHLAGTLAALQHDNTHYRVLAHRSWVQPAEAKSDTAPVRMHSAQGDELDGVVIFYMSRFLHMDLDLRYRDPAEPGGPVYRLTESRRLKSQETNYFDHPRIGVLVRLTQVKSLPKRR